MKESIDVFEAIVLMIIIAVVSLVVSGMYHQNKFENYIKAPCIEECKDKGWVATNIKEDWVGSSCRCIKDVEATK